MVFRLCYLATLTTLALSAPSDFAGSFAHVSSGNAPQKLTSNHFNKADQITKAASSLRSSSQAQATEFKTAKSRFIESTTDALAATHKAKHGAAVEHTNAVNTIRPDRIATPVAVSNNAAVATETNDKHLTNAVAATYHTSMLEVASTSQSQLEMKGASDCEVCVYVVENKQMHQPFLCRGLKDPAYQQTCVTTLISMMWWLENQVYWINYGCQRQSGSGQWEWVKPCPAHAVCAWIQNLYSRASFCPSDPKYRKPA